MQKHQSKKKAVAAFHSLLSRVKVRNAKNRKPWHCEDARGDTGRISGNILYIFTSHLYICTMHFFRGQIVIADTVFNQHPLLSGVHMYNISFRVARRFMFLLQCKQDVFKSRESVHINLPNSISCCQHFVQVFAWVFFLHVEPILFSFDQKIVSICEGKR